MAVNWYGSKIEVDVGIVDLLKLVWQEGFETSNSCQDAKGLVWIQFTYLRDYKQLVQDAAKFGRDLFDLLMESKSELFFEFRDDDDWEEDEEEREVARRRPLEWHVSLLFPKEKQATFARLWKSTYRRKHTAESSEEHETQFNEQETRRTPTSCNKPDYSRCVFVRIAVPLASIAPGH